MEGRRTRRIRTVTSALLLLALISCEDTLTPQLQEVVRVAQLPDRTITIQSPVDATATPSGQQAVKDGEPLGISVTPDTGFTFLYWEKVEGSGTVEFADENAANTTVSVSGGNAVITAYVGNTPRNLTITAGANGSVAPSGTVVVQDGVARNITATPASSAYEFTTWSQTGGTGTVVFGSLASASTTATVTGGDADIEASFALKTYTITVNAGPGGTTSTGSLVVNHGEQSPTISATANGGYIFTGWSVTSGNGLSFNPNTSTASIRITATGGDATIQANFAPTYTLNIGTTTGGYTSPSGNRTVTSGVPLAVTAHPSATYKFVNWTKTSGAGSVVFSDSTSTTTNVTVTGGNVAIQANFTKETVTLVEKGSYQYGNSTTNPNNAKAVYLNNGFLYVVGASGSVTYPGVVRWWDVSSPTAPTSGFNSYLYLNGSAQTVAGNGTYLFVGTSDRIYRGTIGSDGSLSSVTSNTSYGIYDISFASATSFYAIRSNGYVAGYTTTLSSGNIASDSTWSYDFVTALPAGFGAIMEHNGANQLGTYSATIGATQGLTAPDDSVALHNGYDMDPGWAGKGVQDVDREYMIIPVQDENGINSVDFYDITNMSPISADGSATVGKRPAGLAVDTSGANDYYVFATAGNGDGATIYVIDMYSKSSPLVAATHIISGYDSAEAIAADNGYLYVALSDASDPKVTVMVLQVTRN